MTDPITHLLDLMHIRSTAFVGKTLAAPWSIMIEEDAQLARFHLVVAGQTWLAGPGAEEPVQLTTGDIAIIPNGLAHVYSDTPGRKVARSAKLPDFNSGPYFQTLDRNGTETNLLCGYFEISQHTPPAIVTRLPEVLVIRKAETTANPEIASILTFIEDALSGETPPSQVTLNRLTEILCVHAISHWLSGTIGTDAELSALTEPRLGNVLNEIHTAPEQSWSLASLAEISGQSRTAFSVQFKRATGLSPMTYVRRWRMQRAQRLLEDTAMTIDEVAFKSGYADTNAFNRAFKREMGVSPGNIKRSRAN